MVFSQSVRKRYDICAGVGSGGKNILGRRESKVVYDTSYLGGYGSDLHTWLHLGS